MSFRLPKKSYLFLGFVLIPLGATLTWLYNAWPEHQFDWDTYGLAGWILGSVVVAGGVIIVSVALTTDAEVEIDANNKIVTFRFSRPGKSVRWQQPFNEFESIFLQQIKDMHGLHNHWRIELCDKQDHVIRLGYGLFGVFRQGPAEVLSERVASIMSLPCKRL